MQTIYERDSSNEQNGKMTSDVVSGCKTELHEY